MAQKLLVIKVTSHRSCTVCESLKLPYLKKNSILTKRHLHPSIVGHFHSFCVLVMTSVELHIYCMQSGLDPSNVEKRSKLIDFHCSSIYSVGCSSSSHWLRTWTSWMEYIQCLGKLLKDLKSLIRSMKQYVMTNTDPTKISGAYYMNQIKDMTFILQRNAMKWKEKLFPNNVTRECYADQYQCYAKERLWWEYEYIRV